MGYRQAASPHQPPPAPTLGQCCPGNSAFKSHQLHSEAVWIVRPRCCILLHTIRLLLRLLEVLWTVHRLLRLLLLGLLLDIPPRLGLWCIRVHHSCLLLLLRLRLWRLVVLLLLLPCRRLLLRLLRGVILLLLWLL